MRFHVVINPASGQDQPVLSTLKRVFHATDTTWEVMVNSQDGDAYRHAVQTVEVGLDAVGVFGGDGTVMEVLGGLIGADEPLAIFPGGTANVMSIALGIPSDPAEAMVLACGNARMTRYIDVGRVNSRCGLLRLDRSVASSTVEGADRNLKDWPGDLAFGAAAIRALLGASNARYQIEIGGQHVETDSMTCILANSGSLGQLGLSLSPVGRVDDGLLDVVVVRDASLLGRVSVAAAVVLGNEGAEILQHWQGREIEVTADPPQTVQVAGDVVSTFRG